MVTEEVFSRNSLIGTSAPTSSVTVTWHWASTSVQTEDLTVMVAVPGDLAATMPPRTSATLESEELHTRFWSVASSGVTVAFSWT